MTTAKDFQAGVYIVGVAESASGSHDALLSQGGILALGQRPAEFAWDFQRPNAILGAAETSSGEHDVIATQLGAYALVMGFPDRRDLLAWAFPQDDHLFYVLQLGSAATIVYDRSTEQWTQWKSPDYAYWRGADGCDWEGINVCCDPLSGKIWQIDPEGRLDYGTDSITSIIVGGMTERFREYKPVYIAELAVSEGLPPAALEEGTVSISLRTGDGTTWISHGSIPGEAIGEDITVRWYGLGVIKSPGTIFEITDTGYARRIDGLNIEMGE